MHELSIAEAVLAIVAEHAGGRAVERVHVRVGHLRQVSPPALEFAFRLLAAGTPVDGAELVLEEVPAVLRCRRCGSHTTAAGFPLRCVACGDLHPDVVAGEELCVESLEVTQEPLVAEEVR